ncbi:MAG: GFA family protein [Pseudomonadota bacterium]
MTNASQTNDARTVAEAGARVADIPWIGPLAIAGGCACGAVRYTAHGRMRPPIACHCEQCQRASGHVVAAIQVEDAALTITGEGAITWYRSSPIALRGFCRTCGGHLFFKPEGRGRTSIMAGTIERPHPPELRLAAHIYCDDKADYYDIGDDGVARFA